MSREGGSGIQPTVPVVREKQPESPEDHSREPNIPAVQSHLRPRSVFYHDRGRLRVTYFMFYEPEEADHLMRLILDYTTFRTLEGYASGLSGKRFTVPRKIAAFGDDFSTYRFSGVSVNASPWTPLMEGIKRQVEDFTRCSYNFVLLNLYRDGRDKIGAHRDDESSLHRATPIASLSFGATRRIIFSKSGRRTGDDVLHLDLEHGSACVMWPPTNQNYFHEIPEQLEVEHPRLNLTFRRLNPACNYEIR